MGRGHVPSTFFLLSGADSAAKVAWGRRGISTTSRLIRHFTLQGDLLVHLLGKAIPSLYSALRSVYRLLMHPAAACRDHTAATRPPARSGGPPDPRPRCPGGDGKTCLPASPPAPTTRVERNAPTNPKAHPRPGPAATASQAPMCRPRSRSS
ncbi:hypothetical protein STVIR_3845 [Streptomyces viridochromogenes Tue57]|uniref:Uncharacterized protein n=1 Tax=Streptomyces viridochromogenes Tue57 TaxID=1160705 RepID=L8PG31_STRVR|nr:hypothetical protein STVIR_3845 [Streptomyces viridochromogenes Tue57]